MDNFIAWFWDMLAGAFGWLINGIVYLLKSTLWFIFDGILTVITTFFSVLDIGSHVSSLAGYFGLLPPQMLYLINAIGLPSGLSILIWAIGIRMAINLIPSWITRF